MSDVLSNDAMHDRGDLYARVTNQIAAAIEAGAGKFEMPWHSAERPLKFPTNILRCEPYRGINLVALWSQAMTRGYTSSLWGTYRQWQEAGFQVRKGERATTIVYYRQLTESDWEQEDSECAAVRHRYVARAFSVFNANQIEGWTGLTVSSENLVERSDEIEQLVTVVRADVRYGGDIACYRPREDYIQLPDRERFTGTTASSPTESFYSTLLHELVHWTGHPTRLNRDLSGGFGSEAYAMEELVAELGAAFLSAEFLVPNAPRPDHAAYVASWLRVLKSDTRAIFVASRLAGTAVTDLLDA